MFILIIEKVFVEQNEFTIHAQLAVLGFWHVENMFESVPGMMGYRL